MASELRVNTINSRTGFGTITVSETGQDLVGITTIENLTAENTLVGAAASFTGNVSVGGVLTYEDVTNIDSVGLITARQGIEIGARPGVAASISVDGNMIVSGISTIANLYVPDKIIHDGDTNTAIRFPSADTFTVETGGTERLRINSTGQTIVGDSIAQLSTSAERPFQVHSVNGPKIAIGRNDVSIGEGNTIGGLEFYGNDANGTYVNTAAIIVNADDAHDTNDKPTRMQFYTTADGGSSATERLRITSSGALLVGTTSPYYGTTDIGHEIKKNNSRTYTAPLMSQHSHLLLNNSDTTDNCFTGIGFRAGSGDGAIGYVYRGSANNSDFVINTDGNGNGVERLRIFNNGSVLIGALSGQAAGGATSEGSARLVIDCEGLDINDGVGDASNYGLVFCNDPTSNKANGIGFFNDGGTGCGGYIVHQDKGSNNIGDIAFGTSATSDTPVERMRLDKDGHLSVSSTGYMGTFSSSQGQSSFGHNIQSGGRSNRQISANSTGAEIMNCNNTIQAGAACSLLQYRTLNTVEGSIVANGNGLSISNNSDYRKKERITDLTGSLAVLDTLRPRQYYYRAGFGKDTKAFAGFIAHELQSTALPHLTTGVKDAVVTQADKDNDLYGGMAVGDPIYQTVAYSDNELITHLVNGIKELKAEVETLKTEVAALKSS